MSHGYPQKQQGAALVVGLIVLLIMTLLGITSMSSTTTELKMASNLMLQNQSFQEAESIYSAIVDDQYIAVIPDSTWTTNADLSVTALATRGITGGNLNTDVTISYRGCNNTVGGSDVTQTDMEGNNVMSNALVHDVDVVTTIASTTGGVQVGKNQAHRNGKQSIVVMCP